MIICCCICRRAPAATSTSVKLPSPMISADAPKLHGLMSEWTMANHYQCPVALRAQLLGQSLSGQFSILGDKSHLEMNAVNCFY